MPGIRWRDGRAQWSGLDLAARFASKTEYPNADKDKDGYEQSALARRGKYCHIVRRTLRGRSRWYTQLILEGRPPWKDRNPVGRRQTVGLDIGPSTIAAVGEDGAFLDQFCPGAARDQKAIRRIQRAMDRSRRTSNPGHYNADGTIKKSRPRHWVVSQGHVRLRNRLHELQRRQAATRRREHGQLCNRVLAMGETVRAEKLSYKVFQRMFGKSVRDRGTGLFMDELRRKAESSGSQLDEFPTQTTKLSQRCHCRAVVKKPLRQRWHVCTCGVTAQRAS